MQILITGGAGYIGSHTIIDILENTNWEVISVDDYSTSNENAYARIENITGKKVKYYQVDLKNYDDLKKVMEQNDAVTGIIHFAAHKWVGDSVENPLKYYKNNVGGLVNVLNIQKEFNIPYFIFSSSCSVYGNIDELPVTENTKLNKAESPYAYTKQIGEQIITDFVHSEEDKKAISLRFDEAYSDIARLKINDPNN